MERPDLIIAIDFGMAETGVAIAGRNSNIRGGIEVYQDWPGNSYATNNKVPTWLMYDGPGVKHPSSIPMWGYQCLEHTYSNNAGCPNCKQKKPKRHHSRHGKISRRWFKILLEQQKLDKMGKAAPGTHEEVQQWITDYMERIYCDLEEHLKKSDHLLGREWKYATVEFIFSVPTTWESISMIEEFRRLIRRAGFGLGGERHSVTIGLTEASAAAVYTTKSVARNIKKGDSFMICDAGGGTTDVSLLDVGAVQNNYLALKELLPVKGTYVGSTDIDDAFEELVKQRLRKKYGNPSAAAWNAKRMTESERFQNLKRVFGKQQRHAEFMPIEIPCTSCLGPTAESRFKLNYYDLQAMFDAQIAKITGLLEEQLKTMKKLKPTKTISYFILAGGLGSNNYVFQRLEAWKATISREYPAIKDMKLLVSNDPQLAVAKGLIIDQLQTYDHRQSVIALQCCRTNYGLRCNRAYNRRKHHGQKVFVSDYDSKKYVKNQLDWLVTKGAPVKNPIEHKFFRYIERDAPLSELSWRIPIFKSDLTTPPDHLPDDLDPPLDGTGFHAETVTTVGYIPVDFAKKDLEQFSKLASSKWFQRGKKKHYRLDYEIKVFIGPADLRFEMWHNGRRYSHSERIMVGWESIRRPEDGGFMAF